MMHDGMGSMMAWMMGFGLLGWTLVVALLVTILVVLLRLLSRSEPRQGPGAIDDREIGARPRNGPAK
jgi:hypothetical protein